MLIIFNTIFKCLLRKHHIPLLEKHFWVPKVSTKLNNDNDNDNENITMIMIIMILIMKMIMMIMIMVIKI